MQDSNHWKGAAITGLIILILIALISLAIEVDKIENAPPAPTVTH